MSENSNKPRNSTWRLFWQTFIVEDLDAIKDKLIFDYLVPAAKNTIAESGTAFINLLLFGDSRKIYHSSYLGSDNKIRTKYGTISRTTETGVLRNRDSATATDTRDIYSRRASVKYNDIPFSSMMDAEEALSEMRDILEKYNQVSVQDYYEICTRINKEDYHYESDWTVNNFGWTDLSYVKPTRSMNGWYLTLPRAEVIAT